MKPFSETPRKSCIIVEARNTGECILITNTRVDNIIIYRSSTSVIHDSSVFDIV